MTSLLRPEKHGLLLCYLPHECWRLEVARAEDDLRPVIVGCAGTVEMVIEALFARVWPTAIIRQARAAGWKSGATALPDVSTWNGRCPPEEYSPRLSMEKKIQAMSKGAAWFDMWSAGPDELARPVSGHDVLTVRFKIDCMRLLNADGDPSWDSLWGQTIKYPHKADWVELRNAIAHMRVPVFERDMAADAHNELRRWIELLYRVCNDKALVYSPASPSLRASTASTRTTDADPA